MNVSVPQDEDMAAVDPVCLCGTAQGFELEIFPFSWVAGEKAG